MPNGTGLFRSRFLPRLSSDLNRKAPFRSLLTPEIRVFHDLLHKNLSQMGINRDELAFL